MSDKLDGVMHRHKYRIRIYNFSDKIIRLERKSKRGDYISKLSCSISRDLAEQIIAGDPYGLETLNHPLLQDVLPHDDDLSASPCRDRGLCPRGIYSSLRGNAVTFDKQLRTGYVSSDLFNPSCRLIPVWISIR